MKLVILPALTREGAEARVSCFSFANRGLCVPLTPVGRRREPNPKDLFDSSFCVLAFVTFTAKLKIEAP